MAEATERSFMVYVSVPVRIVVRDRDVIRRPVENIDGWRDDLYPLDTEQKVLEHLAFNAVYNHYDNGKYLDGWADLDPDALEMVLVRDGSAEYDIEETTGQ